MNIVVNMDLALGVAENNAVFANARHSSVNVIRRFDQQLRENKM
jgi:hypothetical protein